ncbi:MAG: hypothetical protein ACLU9S_24600 [Oscillospiraceae bacterium]
MKWARTPTEPPCPSPPCLWPRFADQLRPQKGDYIGRAALERQYAPPPMSHEPGLHRSGEICPGAFSPFATAGPGRRGPGMPIFRR